MKKLIIVFGLLLATITAFGKPAYKQWKKDKVSYSINRDKEVEGSYLRLGYMNVRHKTKKDGDFVVGWYLDTNQFISGQARIMVSVSASDKIDFSVGSNTVRYISIGSGITNNVLLTNVSVSDGRYNYFADIGWVEASSLKGGTLFLISCFKDEGSWRLMDCIDIYSKWQDEEAVRVLKAREEERLQAEKQNEVNRINKAKQILNDKKYQVNFDGNLHVLSLPISASSSTVNANKMLNGGKVMLAVLGIETNYHTSRLEIKLMMKAINNYDTMTSAMIFTSDGEYKLEQSFTGWYGVERQFGTQVYIGDIPYVYYTLSIGGRGSSLPKLEKMLNSGKAIKIRFIGSGAGNGDVHYDLTKDDINTLKSLVAVSKQLDYGYYYIPPAGEQWKWLYWNDEELK